MNDLRELIGEKVRVKIETDDDAIYSNAEVIDVVIDDYYFEDKNEPIYIGLNLKPIDMPDGLDYEDFIDVPLDNIRKA